MHTTYFVVCLIFLISIVLSHRFSFVSVNKQFHLYNASCLVAYGVDDNPQLLHITVHQVGLNPQGANADVFAPQYGHGISEMLSGMRISYYAYATFLFPLQNSILISLVHFRCLLETR